MIRKSFNLQAACMLVSLCGVMAMLFIFAHALKKGEDARAQAREADKRAMAAFAARPAIENNNLILVPSIGRMDPVSELYLVGKAKGLTPAGSSILYRDLGKFSKDFRVIAFLGESKESPKDGLWIHHPAFLVLGEEGYKKVPAESVPSGTRYLAFYMPR